MSPWFAILVQGTLLAYALVGGVFLGFSDFIMRSLAKTPGTGGVEAMQSINREVFRWIFMTLFLGLVPISLVIVGYGMAVLPPQQGIVFALAGGLYTIGCFGVTAAGNVPLNKALAQMDSSLDTTDAFWRNTYVPRWTFWNSVRTFACIAAAVLLVCGIMSAYAH